MSDDYMQEHPSEKQLAGIFAEHVWPAHSDARLKAIQIVHSVGDSPITGSLIREDGGCTILVRGGRPPGEFIHTLLHELAHARHNAPRNGSGVVDMDAKLAVMRGDPMAVARHRAAREPADEEETVCDGWAKSMGILYADGMIKAAEGDLVPLRSMLKAVCGSGASAAQSKASGGPAISRQPKSWAGAIKAIISDGGEWALDVLGAPFGGPHNLDADGEYFDAATDFHDDKFGLPPVVYYHGRQGDGKPAGTPVYLGRTIKRWIDKAGVWFRVVLDKATDEARRIWEAAQQNTARASTGTLGNLARVDRGGHIREWPIAELSLLDAEGKRQPANRYAVVMLAMKAVYDAAGLELPAEAYGPGPGLSEADMAAAGQGRMRMQLLKNRLTMGAGPTGSDKAAAIRRLRLLVARLDAMENF